MKNYMESVVIELEDIENNGASDWLTKESTRLVACSLAPQARKLQFINKLLSSDKGRIQATLKVVSSVARSKNNCPTTKIETTEPRIKNLVAKVKSHPSH